jgi:hypothetical protein
MFRADLKRNLEKIFGMKVTFDEPGESQEQGKLFIKIDKAMSAVKKGREMSRAAGSIYAYARGESLPYGFFHKKINSADTALTLGLFFHNLDENENESNDIVKRKCGFVYLHSAEYDPRAGSLTELELSEA